jgi:hypothetical protein
MPEINYLDVSQNFKGMINADTITEILRLLLSMEICSIIASDRKHSFVFKKKSTITGAGDRVFISPGKFARAGKRYLLL